MALSAVSAGVTSGIGGVLAEAGIVLSDDAASVDLPNNRHTMTKATDRNAKRATSWVSHGFEVLQAEQAINGGLRFDVLIVGSGYGGAVAADRLAARMHADGSPLRIAVLERGREYLRGAFPDTLADLAGHVRFATEGAGYSRGRLEGLFDVRLGSDMSVLVANGVGGGSLINAGVMLFPEDEVFSRPPWPQAVDVADLKRRAMNLKIELGAALLDGSDNTVLDDLGIPRPAAMARIDHRHQRVPLTIALDDGRSTCAGVKLERCIGCGDCATGCNHGAKISLDLNLLRRAQQRGVRVYAGATVSLLRQAADGGWELEAWHTDLALRRRMAGPLKLQAGRVVLAAGTLGSTELLLRSQSPALRFSGLLGQRFSGNGDVIAALYDGAERMHAVADDAVQPSRRAVGPTITGMLDWRDGNAGRAGCLVQDLAVPGALRRVFEEITATTDLLHRLGRCDRDAHHPNDSATDPNAVDPDKVDRSTVVAIITRDAADGVMTAVPSVAPGPMEQGLVVDPGLRIHWRSARDDPRIEACHQRLEEAVGGSIAGKVLPNPAWRLLPREMEDVLGGTERGPLFTVHPLGGCAMGTGRADGVVDHLGRVFDGNEQTAANTVHEGLVVLDGSIVPCALGVNPALTIAALADRAIDGLCAGARYLRGVAAPASVAPAAVVERPRFVLDTDRPRRRHPTRIEVVERLSGVVQLQGQRFFVELSLRYRPMHAPAQGATLRGRCLSVGSDAVLSRLRIFADETPPKEGIHRLARDEERRRRRLTDERADDDALVIVPVVGGTLRLLHRESSSAWGRVGRAGLAWAANRGVRDIWQALADQLAVCAQQPVGAGGRLRQAIALASRAGQVRLFDYALDLGAPEFPQGSVPAAFAAWRGAGTRRIAGRKRLTYARRSSPIAQLMQLELTEFGGLRIGTPKTIEVSPSYFAQMQLPLLRIVRQPHLPGAYSDLLSFGLYLLRVLLEIHLWTLRKPDTPTRTQFDRLPGPLPRLPLPEVHRIDPGDGQGAHCRLTVYPRRGGSAGGRPPVLMIHGYSASGTTFAHPALPGSGLAAHLWRAHAEPWVLDLRSSCGMADMAKRPWAFEDMAEHDIPAAVEFVCKHTGHAQIDVVSHCMGSAMFAMAVLGDDAVSARVLPHVRRWVMSQVTPAVVFSPANLLRAYLLQYALNLLPGLDYPIGGPGGPAGVGADAFDRLLAALPYRGEGRASEFDIENPPPWRFWQRTPWVRTRHRLDALFGRVFDARKLAPHTLEHIDDFFGEISLATVSQTIHMARNGFAASRDGVSARYIARDRLPRLRDLPMLSLHVRDSGLADWETGLRFDAISSHYGLRNYRALLIEDCGHQDLLIGTHAPGVFAHIDEFLGED